MSRHSYTSVHDLKDIFCMIYGGNKDFNVKFWNFADGKHYTLSFDHINGWVKPDGGTNYELIFNASAKKSSDDHYAAITSVGMWQSLLTKIDRNTLDWEDAKVTVFNKDNGEWMNIVFTGSSNETKEVNYNINYDNPNFHKLRGDIRMKWVVLKYKLCRFFHLNRS